MHERCEIRAGLRTYVTNMSGVSPPFPFVVESYGVFELEIRVGATIPSSSGDLPWQSDFERLGSYLRPLVYSPASTRHANIERSSPSGAWA